MNWNITFNQSINPDIGTSRAFGFLRDGRSPPDLGPINGVTPPEDNRYVDAMNNLRTDMSDRQKSPCDGLSMDLRQDHSTQLIGFSNESDPFSLHHFPYNDADEVDFFRVTYRIQPGRGSSSCNDGPSDCPPIHFLQSQTGTVTDIRKTVDQCMSSDDERAKLEKLVDRESGVALVRL